MTCPNCSSNAVHGPRYRSFPGIPGRAAVMECRTCASTFDAYEWTGTRRSQR